MAGELDQGAVVLHRPKTVEKDTYKLSSTGELSSIVNNTGRSWKVLTDRGTISEPVIRINEAANSLSFSGWAVNESNGKVPDTILLLTDAASVGSASVGLPTPLLADVYGSESAAYAGYTITAPIEKLKSARTVQLSCLFSDGEALVITVPINSWSASEESMKRPTYEFPTLTNLNRWREIQYNANQGLLHEPDNEFQYTLSAGSLRGSVGLLQEENGVFALAGWAVDIQKNVPAEWIVIFRNGKLWHQSRLWRHRQDVADFFDESSFGKSGFLYRFSDEQIDSLAGQSVQFFALSADGRASELVYDGQYPWSAE